MLLKLDSLFILTLLISVDYVYTYSLIAHLGVSPLTLLSEGDPVGRDAMRWTDSGRRCKIVRGCGCFLRFAIRPTWMFRHGS